MRRRYLADITEYSAPGALGGTYQHYFCRAVLVYHVLYRWVLQQRFYLACEYYSVCGARVKQRLNAYPVPGEEQCFIAAVPDRKREYSVEPLNAFLTPRRVRLQNNLGIRMPIELNTAGLKLPAKLRSVVKLTVVY